MKSILITISLLILSSNFAQATTCKIVEPCKHASYGTFPVCFKEVVIKANEVLITRVESGQNGVNLPSLRYEIIDNSAQQVIAVDRRNIKNKIKINLNPQVLFGDFTYNFDGEKHYEVECNPL